MILDMQGGFKTEERGGVEVKVRIGLKQWIFDPKSWLFFSKHNELKCGKKSIFAGMLSC